MSEACRIGHAALRRAAPACLRWPVVFGLLAVLVPAAAAQVSPGPLSRSHRSLEGPKQCFRCHARTAEEMRGQCLDCHKEIAWLQSNGRGLHGRPGIGECAGCHAEHGGSDASLIWFAEGEVSQFDHARAGWPLSGRHATVQCGECHQDRFRTSDAARLSRREDPANSYIGLERECVACHRDAHRGTLGTDCSECHLPTAWRATPGFDHAQTGYKLTGGHSGVECRKCHPSSVGRGAEQREGARAVSRTLPHAECSPCHRDVHQGRAGTSCSRCHTTAGFQRVREVVFDHQRTRYPLEGRHLDVKCGACHRREARATGAPSATVSLAHDRCSDCHADTHGGQFVGRGERGDCAACHRVDGWRPTTFSASDHARLGLPLEGRHAKIECAACHGPDRKGSQRALPAGTPGTARWALALGDVPCVACHADPHQGYFAAAARGPKKQDCLVCHNVEAFRPSIVDARVHRRFDFPLAGAHLATPCERCHKGMADRSPVPAIPAVARDGAAPLIFTAEGKCVSCHENPHGRQFAQRSDEGSCGACHGDRTFKPATRFDHDTGTVFPLLQAHRDVACDRCHERKEDVAGRLRMVYRPLTSVCRDCHRMPIRNRRARGNRSG